MVWVPVVWVVTELEVPVLDAPVGKLKLGVLKVGAPNVPVEVGPSGAVFDGKPFVPSVPVVLGKPVVVVMDWTPVDVPLIPGVPIPGVTIPGVTIVVTFP